MSYIRRSLLCCRHVQQLVVAIGCVMCSESVYLCVSCHHPDMFDEAQKYVFGIMEETIHKRFLFSDDGLKYLESLVQRDIEKRRRSRCVQFVCSFCVCVCGVCVVCVCMVCVVSVVCVCGMFMCMYVYVRTYNSASAMVVFP